MVCNSDSRIVDTDTEGVQPQQHEKKKVHQNNHLKLMELKIDIHHDLPY